MSETVRVYHGSKRGLEGAIRADRGNPAADFGAGFYMGTDAHQPQTLICGGASRDIYRMADYRTMDKVYAGYHTLSCDMAVDRLKEDFSEANNNEMTKERKIDG